MPLIITWSGVRACQQCRMSLKFKKLIDDPAYLGDQLGVAIIIVETHPKDLTTRVTCGRRILGSAPLPNLAGFSSSMRRWGMRFLL